jgi:hypothetical protein
VPAFLHTVLGTSAEKREREDLARIVATLREIQPAATIEAYFAAKGGDGAVEFTREA